MMKWFKKHKRDFYPEVIAQFCGGCGTCTQTCRHDVFRLHHTEDTATSWVAFPERCTGCGKCVKRCGNKAIMITGDYVDRNCVLTY